MQPVQDLTVESRVSRTQFQYTLEDASAAELAAWTPRLVEKLKERPELRDVASDQQNGGLEANLIIDRDTASRLGVPIQAIDDTLYDAFGQRQVSTIFTQLNQYHVVLEVDPHFQRSPEALKDIYVHAADGKQVPLSAFTHFETGPTTLVGQPPGPVPGGDALLQPGARHLPRPRHARHPRGGGARSACRRASAPTSRERPRPSSERSRARSG